MGFYKKLLTLNVSWSEENEQFVALVPQLPGLRAFGDTWEEAAKIAEEIAESMIQIQIEDGELEKE